MGVVVHDAGATNIILAYLEGVRFDVKILASGPAVKLFQDAKLDHLFVSQFDFLQQAFDVILLGQNFKAPIDKLIIRHFQHSDVLLIAVLDHWTFTRKQYVIDEVELLPDCFVVNDSKALQRASKEFPSVSIVLIPNYYIEKCKVLYADLPIPKDYETNILYISESIDSESNPEFGQTYKSDDAGELDFHAFLFLIQNIEFFGREKRKLIIRPHPSEPLGKFDQRFLNHSLDITVSSETDLVKDLRRSRIVVGIQSMAMVVAVELGCEVYSCLPPNSGANPIEGYRIPYLRDLIQ